MTTTRATTVKAAIDALLEALTHPSLYLSGDEDGGVGLHCHPCFDGGRPLAYYERSGSACVDPAVPTVVTIPGLWAQAADHLATHHRET